MNPLNFYRQILPRTYVGAGGPIGIGLGIESFEKIVFRGDGPHDVTLRKKGVLYKIIVLSTSMYSKFGVFYCIYESQIASKVNIINSSVIKASLNGDTGVLTISDSGNCIVYIEELVS